MPTQDYGDISHNVTPAINSLDQVTDTALSITFDNDIASGNKGQIQVYNAETDEIVDTINPKDEVDIIGYEGQDKHRVVNTSLLSIDGKTLTIRLHNNKLKYGQSYYVAIGDGVVTGAKLNGIDFVGIGKNSAWQFTTKATMPTGTHLTVGPTPDDDFASVQGALNHAMQNLTADTPTTITIHDGVYHELLFLRNRNNITLKGKAVTVQLFNSITTKH
ncbi:Ig-like domain-containing protein [Vibrio sp. PP-XX7]